jgi:hypothetical protein
MTTVHCVYASSPQQLICTNTPPESKSASDTPNNRGAYWSTQSPHDKAVTACRSAKNAPTASRLDSKSVTEFGNRSRGCRTFENRHASDTPNNRGAYGSTQSPHDKAVTACRSAKNAPSASGLDSKSVTEFGNRSRGCRTFEN